MERSSKFALIGSGRMGSFHAQTLSQRLPGARLIAVADPAPGAAAKLARDLATARYPSAARDAGAARDPSTARDLDAARDRGAAHGPSAAHDPSAAPGPDAVRAYTDPAQVWADPEIDAVVIAAPARFHTDLIVAAARAGKHVFCEKPMALTLADADRAIDACRTAGVHLQVGFNRRFVPDWSAARALIDAGRVGTPRLLRSLTRDPGGFDPSRVAPGTIFLETLIHDFDTLRFLNPGAAAVEVYAAADALVEPAWRDRGLLDTAIVTIRFDNGAIGTAEACFEASYGYDVRGEVLGATGMATMGDGRRTGMVFSGSDGRVIDTARSDQELFGAAYTAELAAFADAVRTGTPPTVTGDDARAALAIALAAGESARTGKPAAVAK